MKSYLNDPEATANAIRKHEDGEYWVETGDIGLRDPDGFYHFLSRIKRMIKVSGVPVYPSQVETLIAELPEVLQGGRDRHTAPVQNASRQSVCQCP